MKFISALIVFTFFQINANSQSYEELKNNALQFSTTDKEKSLYYARLAASEAANAYGKHSKNYGESLNFLGEAYKNTENYNESEKVLLLAHNIFVDSLYNTDENGINLLSLGKHYHQRNNINEATKWFEKFTKFTSQTSSDCKGGYSYIGDFYYDIGEYKKAKFYLEKYVYDCEFLAEKLPLEFAFRIEKLANFYNDSGDYSSTVILYNRCFPIFKKYFPNEHPEFAYIQAKYLDFLIKIKNFEGANQVVNSLFEIPYTKSSFEILQSISEAFVQMKKYKEAEIFFEYAYKINYQNAQNDDKSTIKLLNSIGAFYIQQNNTKKAEDFLVSSEKIIEKKNFLNSIKQNQASDDDKNLYINTLINLAELSIAKKDYTKSIKHAQNAWKIASNAPKIDEERKRKILSLLLISYDAEDDYHMVEKIGDIDINEAFGSHTLRLLPAIGSNSRIEFLENYEKYNHTLTSILTRSKNKIKNCSELIYNFSLQNKGIALEWNINDLAQIRQSKDSTIDILHKKWQFFKNKLNKLEEKEVSFQQLKQEVDALEFQLRQKLGFNEKIIKKTEWQDVRAQLNPNELAIEFFVLPYYNPIEKKYSGDTLYFANLLDFTSSSPNLLYLFEQKELNKLIQNGDDFYNDPKSYQLIWEKIQPFTQNINKIYHSSQGLLHNVNLHALATPTNKRLIDFFEFQTVFSTKSIGNTDDEYLNTSEEVLIFAGINYDYASPILEFSANKLNNASSKIPISYENNAKIYTNTQNSYNFSILPHSLEEGNIIFKTCAEFKIKSRFFQKEFATEQNLLFSIASNPTSPNALVISSHGFFYNKELGSERTISPMQRCGLIMAGGNKTFNKKYQDAGREDDGVLYGFEIEQLDLSETKIVLLPTCQSADGELKNTEGVLGLQRAFKLAGVEFLLMHKNEANDRKTNEFVVHFFTKIAKGEKITSAFYTTQIFFRQKYPNALDWANWVLLK